MEIKSDIAETLVTKYGEAATKAKAQVDIFEAAELPKPEQIGIEEGK